MELFIQQFLLHAAKDVVIVVNQLTFADQKLINRIKTEFKGKKKIFVVHNFSTLYTRSDVERYIKKNILQTFKVAATNFPNIHGQNLNSIYYVEKEKDEICHVVLAKDGSEAGIYYNETSKKILYANICSVNLQAHFYLEDALKDYLKSQFFKYIENYQSTDLEFKTEKAVDQPAIDEDETKSQDKQVKQKEFLKLISKSSKPIEFKRCDYDELGYIKQYYATSRGQPLPHQFFDAGNSYVLQVEMAGFSQEDLKGIKCKRIKDEDGNSFSYVIEATKKIERPEHYIMDPTIQYGDVICQTDKIFFSKHEDFGDKVTKTIQDGVLTITWNKREMIGLDEF